MQELTTRLPKRTYPILLIAACFIAGWLGGRMGSSGPSVTAAATVGTLQAHSFELLNADGKPAGRWSTDSNGISKFCFVDATGRCAIELRAGESGGGSLFLLAPSGDTAVALSS